MVTFFGSEIVLMYVESPVPVVGVAVGDICVYRKKYSDGSEAVLPVVADSAYFGPENAPRLTADLNAFSSAGV